MIGWLRQQRHALGSALRRLGKQPVSTMLTALAMGVALSLPAGLYLALGNLDQLAGKLPAQPEISLFLDAGASAEQKQAVAARVRQGDITQARYISKEEAIAALSASQGLADVAAGLPQNPLPDAWVIRPKVSSREGMTRIAESLGKLPGVAETHVDSQWADRLQAVLAIGRTGVWLLGTLFAIALAAISGNAIRAQVLAQRDEILVSRLIGATDHYIRRPFLYLGALQGLLGGLAAGGVLGVAGLLLRREVEHLAELYGSTYQLQPPTGLEAAAVLGLTALFGWLGAWITVTRALHQVDSAR